MKALLLAFVLVFVPRPQAEAPGSIEGLVVQLGTGTPVVGAQVSIGRAQAMTDENGKFGFANVQPGRYRLVADHIAYTPAQYGERSRNGGGGDVTIGPGQVLRDIVIVLVPKGAIVGHVYTASGDPISNANVQALKYAYQEGRRILIPVVTAKTDGAGEYRLPSLTPGSYIISATLQAFTGLYMAAKTGSGDPLIGEPMTLAAISAAVLGGVSFLGGQGTMRGALAGSLLMSILINVMFFMGLPLVAQYVVQGLIIVVTVALPLIRASLRRAS